MPRSLTHSEYARKWQNITLDKTKLQSILGHELIELASRLGNIWGFDSSSAMLGEELGNQIDDAYDGFLRRLQRTFSWCPHKHVDALIAAEGITLHHTFKDKYLLLIGNFLAEREQRHLKTKTITPEIEESYLSKLYGRIKREGIQQILDDIGGHATTTHAELMRKHLYFGALLEDQRSELDVPVILLQLMQHIADNGIREKGIFSVPAPDPDRLQELKLAFESGQPVDLNRHNIHCACSLLKMYFRELPEPIFTYNLYRNLIASHANILDEELHETTTVAAASVAAVDVSGSTSSIGTAAEAAAAAAAAAGTVAVVCNRDHLEALRVMLRDLPRANHAVIAHLMRFLAVVCASGNARRNKMNDTVISILFGPNLIRPPVETVDSFFNDTKIVNSIIKTIIRHVGFFFDEDRTAPASTAAAETAAAVATATATPQADTTQPSPGGSVSHQRRSREERHAHKHASDKGDL
eukprot:TRINITY_DN1334_c1_g1_i2.p1 TRINITY_DN1334_c1_g1~~TRINITY_DN1334_c1_g1_i2.p1  ORF type:complete len:469 (-),score=121.80 TRINITY_DN1334_c1_g1_i2:1976-3382(-)